MDCKPGMFPTHRAAAIYFLRLLILMAASLLSGAAIVTLVVWTFKAVLR